MNHQKDEAPCLRRSLYYVAVVKDIYLKYHKQATNSVRSLLGGGVSAPLHGGTDAKAGADAGAKRRRALRVVMLLLHGLLHPVASVRRLLQGLQLAGGAVQHHHARLRRLGIERCGAHHLLGEGPADAAAVKILHLRQGPALHAAPLGRSLRAHRRALAFGRLGLLPLLLSVHHGQRADGLLIDVVEVHQGLHGAAHLVNLGLDLGNSGGTALTEHLHGDDVVVRVVFWGTLLGGGVLGSSLLLGGLLVVLGRLLLLGRRRGVVLLLLGRGRGVVLLLVLLQVLLLGRGAGAGREGGELLRGGLRGGAVLAQDVGRHVLVGGGLGRERVQGGPGGRRIGGGSGVRVEEGGLGGEEIRPGGLVVLFGGGAGERRGILSGGGHAVVAVGLPRRGAPMAHHAAGVRAVRDAAQLVHLGHVEEAHAVEEDLVLLEVRAGLHGGGGVRDELDHVVSPHGPAGLELARRHLAHGVVDLLAVGQNEALPRRQGPDEDDLVLLSPAVGAGLAGREGVLVRETEAEAHAALGVGEGLARGSREDVDLVGGVAAAEAGVDPGGAADVGGHVVGLAARAG